VSLKAESGEGGDVSATDHHQPHEEDDAAAGADAAHHSRILLWQYHFFVDAN